jgi:hypothetical protein
MAMSWHRWLVTSPLPQRHSLDSRPAHVKYVENEGARGKVSIQILQFSHVSIIPVMFHTFSQAITNAIQSYQWTVLLNNKINNYA